MLLFGKLHPLLVHLPIGFLLIGLILHWWQSYDPRKQFENAIGPIFLFGAISATLSCLTGLQLMQGGEYDPTIIERHRNTGISLAVLSFYVWYLHWKNAPQKNKHFFAAALFILIIITGHYGGTLTHGSEFFRFTASTDTYQEPDIKNIDEAVVYHDLIQPILIKKCVACHGAEKMKGNLRLDHEDFMLKGGKNGGLLAKADPLLLKRILLPPDNEDHMPPKEKGQLTMDELALIKWWIQEGADFKATVAQLKKDVTIQVVLNRKKSNQPSQEPVVEKLPEVPAADPEILAALRSKGASITPVSSTSNLLIANLVNLKDSSVTFWQTLAKIAPQLMSIKADLSFVKDEHIQTLAGCAALRRLSLKGSKITDACFQTINKLSDLQSLNISNTSITAKGLSSLNQNKNLRYLYILNLSDSSIQFSMTNVEVIDRTYAVPTLESDTSIVKESKD